MTKPGTSIVQTAASCIRSVGYALVTLGILAGCKVTSHAGDVERPAAVTDDRLIVALVPDEQASQNVQTAATGAGYTLLRMTELQALGLKMLSFEMPDGVTGAQAIRFLEGAEPSSTVGINHAFFLQQSSAPAAGLEYANALLDWPRGGCTAMGPVGLIDSGIDPEAPALVGTNVISRRFARGAAAGKRHGTEVASVLANPTRLHRTTIYSADVIGQTPDGGVSAGADSLVRAIDWLAGENVRVVNLSLAGPYNKLLNLAVNAAAARGMLMIAAVGNAGPTSAPQYPAGFEPVIAVTAVDASRRIYRGAVQGTHVDIAAPGVDVFVPLGESGRFVTGTSIAAPFVAARVLADRDLLASADISELRAKLIARAEDLGPTGTDPQFGAGLMTAQGVCDVRGS